MWTRRTSRPPCDQAGIVVWRQFVFSADSSSRGAGKFIVGTREAPPHHGCEQRRPWSFCTPGLPVRPGRPGRRKTAHVEGFFLFFLSVELESPLSAADRRRS